jgi:hypothetical protein
MREPDADNTCRVGTDADYKRTAEHKYKLFANYVRGTADCSPGDEETAACAIESAKRYRPPDHLELTPDALRTLHLAWGREQACHQHEDVATQRVVAPFLATSSYYALLSAHNVTYTLSCARDSRSSQHNEVAGLFRAERECLALPWSLGLQGNPDNPATLMLFDSGHVGRLEPAPLRYPARWDANANPQAYALAALKSARRFSFALQEQRQLDKRGRTQFTPVEVAEIYGRIYETTALDFIKELRERADYKGAAELAASVPDEVVERYYTGLCDLLRTGLVVAEARIIGRVGWAAYEHAARDWLDRTDAASGLAARLELLRAATKSSDL